MNYKFSLFQISSCLSVVHQKSQTFSAAVSSAMTPVPWRVATVLHPVSELIFRWAPNLPLQVGRKYTGILEKL